ncbi:hypothetical protein [Sphaerospermopsis aphanizomenoides]|uniref:hypothetical protein n=1 Tax=Sphaerospermopsis aphanizomenoides TaxID=459663 RepID=UPI0019054DB0|nr:hypothetical protein [Sphaerospermopsis aphanizomenoides]
MANATLRYQKFRSATRRLELTLTGVRRKDTFGFLIPYTLQPTPYPFSSPVPCHLLP